MVTFEKQRRAQPKQFPAGHEGFWRPISVVSSCADRRDQLAVLSRPSAPAFMCSLYSSGLCGRPIR
jgi:hypothetical protein